MTIKNFVDSFCFLKTLYILLNALKTPDLQFLLTIFQVAKRSQTSKKNKTRYPSIDCKYISPIQKPCSSVSLKALKNELNLSKKKQSQSF